MTSAVEEPELVSVTSKGQVTIPVGVREEYDIKEGDKLVAVPTDQGIILKKLDIPSIEEFRERVEERDRDIEMDEIVEKVHERRSDK